MRTSNICCRVEPETARGLTWLTNKYNYEHNASMTKTDMIELLIKAAIKDEDVIGLALCLTGAEGAAKSYKIYLEN